MERKDNDPQATTITCIGCESDPTPLEDLPEGDLAWQQRLTPEQFHVLRQGGTEPSHSGAYLQHWEDGLYLCAGCGNSLYDSTTKYDACGWPSFWDAIEGAISTRGDPPVQEARCRRCDGHLGHVFSDGPPPTGLRH